MSLSIYRNTSYKISRLITINYSTSFSLATALLEKKKKEAIYAVYGFVRLADEIVDTFHDADKPFLLQQLKKDLAYALKEEMSTNPVLFAFQDTVTTYAISHDHIAAFINSMEMDLEKKAYHHTDEMHEYIYGSAEVVGLMCLKIFCNGDESLYQNLLKPARALGSAFQKVNFLRDIKHDNLELGRVYFPDLTDNHITEEIKHSIVADINTELDEAYQGIKRLKGRSKLAVYVAYSYYKNLLNKIKRSPASALHHRRIRISNFKKILLMTRSFLLYKVKMI